MADRPHFSVAEIATALRASHGIKAVAVRRVGCGLMTIDRYIAKHPTCAQACKAGRASIVDMAEGQLVRKVIAGEWAAVHFTLTTLGRDRGYGAQIDINLVIRQEVARIVERDGLTEGRTSRPAR